MDASVTGDGSSEGCKVLRLTKRDGGTATIVGTSHLPSQGDLSYIRSMVDLKPDAVLLELDRDRAESLHIVPAASHPFKCEVVESFPKPAHLVFPGLTSIVWAVMASFSAMIFFDLSDHTQMGMEQIVAAQTAVEGTKLVLGDRSLVITLARLGTQITLADLFHLLPSAVGGLSLQPGFKPDNADVWHLCRAVATRRYADIATVLARIEQASFAANPSFQSSVNGRYLAALNYYMLLALREGKLDREQTREAQHYFQQALRSLELTDTSFMPPAVAAERDHLLAHAINNTPGEAVVAVVGRGHIDGIRRYWDCDHSPLYMNTFPLSESAKNAAVPATVLVGSIVGYRSLRRVAPRLGLAVLGVGALGVGGVAAVVMGIAATHTRIRNALR